jgi:hypothetical protein
MAESMKDLFELLPGLLKAFPETEEVREAVVFAVWQKAGGEGLEPHSIPVELNKKRLTVAVRDKIWKRHLESMAPQLLCRLNALLRSPVVNFIELIINEELFEQTENKQTDKNLADLKLSEQIGSEVSESAKVIKDPALRAKFEDAAKAYLVRQNLNR